MMTLHDRLYGYHALLTADLSDTDLSPEDRRQVARRIGEAVQLLRKKGIERLDLRFVQRPLKPHSARKRVADHP